MKRLLALSAAGSVVFIGFGLPFLLPPGRQGLIAGVLVVIIGSALLALAESRTKHALDDDTTWNRLMKADGEDLIERDEQAEETARDRVVVFLSIAIGFGFAWTAAVVQDFFGRRWFLAFGLGALLACWLAGRAFMRWWSRRKNAGDSR